ncbi:MAG: extracellular solute-binding protein [Paracoccus sp. (in: a-proteobacteria)]|nr:extracellular solute-binding protein [Paracoccus sp. (in: a-proteobacteria)]
MTGNREALRVVGTSVTLPEPLRRRAVEDLGFPIRFTILDGESCLRQGVLHPESYDVYDQWFYSAELLWTAGAIQAIDTTRIDRWRDVVLPDGGQGARPGDVLYVQHDQRLGPAPSSAISMLPTTYNADSFAWGPEVRDLLRPDEEASWAWLFDERWHGRCTVNHDPAVGVVELALGARAAGLMKVQDVGNLSIDEIDRLFDLLERRRKSGHFNRCWSTHEESIRQMSGANCVLGALWAPAYYALRAAGHDLSYAVPREGYRSWQSGLCLSSALHPAQRDMAYSYLNWWLSGVPGALLARQGYYMSVIDPVAEILSPAEHGYWYEGLPASEMLHGLDGRVVVRKGERREGGSHRDRIARIVLWSTLMPEHNYLARRWRAFWSGAAAPGGAGR